MESYFNVKLEFDRAKVNNIITKTIEESGKGYVCSVEGNIITIANNDKYFNEIVNNALVNICDGSSIAFLLSAIYKNRFRNYIGADLFIEFIKQCKFKSYFIGNTSEVLEGLKRNLSTFDSRIVSMKFESLPFMSIDEFDYKSIAESINNDNPDIIWVSLGAPKQEIFMSKLLPYLNRGVLFGFGAIFNFYSLQSQEKRAPKLLLNLKAEWVYRLINNPGKQWPRIKNILGTYPNMIFNEIRYKRIK